MCCQCRTRSVVFPQNSQESPCNRELRMAFFSSWTARNDPTVGRYGSMEDPIPLLEFVIHHGQGVPPSEPSCQTMIKSGGAHVLWIDRRGCYGNPENLHIHQKQRRIFPRMTQGIPRQSALGAGVEIRRLCREAWAKGAGKKLDAFWLSGLWKSRAFERDFDRILIERIGRPRLEEILRDLGSTTLDCWLDVQ
jgi:hypothetical protein